MSTITPSLYGLCATTTGLGSFFGTPSNPAPTTHPLRVQRASPVALEESSSSIDDFIAELCAEDPRLEATIEEGTRWVGRTYYGSESESIKTMRMKAGFSQASLAKRMGTSQSHVARIETGELDASISTVSRLADALAQPPIRVFELLLQNYEKRHAQS